MIPSKHTIIGSTLALTTLAAFGCDEPNSRNDEADVEFISVSDDSEEAPAADLQLFQWRATVDGTPAFVPTDRVSAEAPCEEEGTQMTELDQISLAPEVPEHLTGGPGWHYTTWPETGFRPYNPSGCGGTKHCVFGPGTWVRFAGTYGTCNAAPWDVYVHDTPCGSGWVRADALN